MILFQKCNQCWIIVYEFIHRWGPGSSCERHTFKVSVKGEGSLTEYTPNNHNKNHFIVWIALELLHPCVSTHWIKVHLGLTESSVQGRGNIVLKLFWGSLTNRKPKENHSVSQGMAPCEPGLCRPGTPGMGPQCCPLHGGGTCPPHYANEWAIHESGPDWAGSMARSSQPLAQYWSHPATKKMIFRFKPETAYKQPHIKMQLTQAVSPESESSSLHIG